MDSSGEAAGEGFDVARRIGAMLRDEFDERRADDDAIGDPRDRGGLLGRADAEADRDRQVGLPSRRATASSMLACAACCSPVIPATLT